MAVQWVLFDMNGTLLDPAPIGETLGEADGEEFALAALDEALLYSMADTLSGGYRSLPDYLRAALERRLAVAGRDAALLDEAMDRGGRLPPFPDARRAIELLTEAEFEVGVLTNSATDAADRALKDARLSDGLGVVIGVDEVEVFKPHPRVYQHALERVGATPDQVCMVAAHGWDLMGAGRIGMRTAWIARKEGRVPAVVPPPDIQARDLAEAAALIIERFRQAPR